MFPNKFIISNDNNNHNSLGTYETYGTGFELSVGRMNIGI